MRFPGPLFSRCSLWWPTSVQVVSLERSMEVLTEANSDVHRCPLSLGRRHTMSSLTTIHGKMNKKVSGPPRQRSGANKRIRPCGRSKYSCICVPRILRPDSSSSAKFHRKHPLNYTLHQTMPKHSPLHSLYYNLMTCTPSLRSYSGP